MSSRNLAALAAAVAAGVAGGVYTFGPVLKEQQEAQENWKNPIESGMKPAVQDKSAQAQDQADAPSSLKTEK